MFIDEASWVSYLASCLKGAVADWYVALYETNGPELHLVQVFVRALRAQFEDPLVQCLEATVPGIQVSSGILGRVLQAGRQGA